MYMFIHLCKVYIYRKFVDFQPNILIKRYFTFKTPSDTLRRLENSKHRLQ